MNDNNGDLVYYDVHNTYNPEARNSYREEAMKVKENMSDKTKLQDALLVLNKMNGSMDLIFMIKKRLKEYKK